MRKKFTFALISFLVVPLTMMAQTGTKGNTITFDSDNSTMLYTELDANTSNSAFSCYLRHNQAPIQLLNANPENVSSGNTVATLQSASGTGTGFFANSSLANNMGFSGTSSQANRKVQFYNLASSSTNWKNSPYKYICFAVIAPRGYRFTEYYMDIDGSKGTNGANGATIMRYTYIAGSTYQITTYPDESLGLTSATSQIFTHTLTSAKNVLYFRIEVSDAFYNANKQVCVTMNQLRLTYVIDGDIEATIPNDESSVGNKVHTGIINLGTFTRKGTSGDYYFDKKQVNDLENVNIVEKTVGLIEQPKIDNNAIFVPAGTYWIESPAKFRITKAKVTFKAMSVTGGIGERSTTFTPGKTYLIGDGSGNYMGRRAQGTTTASATSNQSNQNNAERWTITKTSSGKYTIQNSEGNYLYLNNGQLGLIADLNNIPSGNYYSGVWSYNSSNRSFSATSGDRTYSIYYTNGWALSRWGYYTSLYFYEVAASITADNYTAEVYNRENTGVEGSVTINSANNASSGYVELTELNNDGIKFTVDGDAAFTVDLTLHPLDPTLQNLEFGYKVTSGEPNLVSAAATNFKFNNGEAIVIPIESGVSSPKAIFRNAYNENRRDWYNPGSGTKLSNYYLIDSEYETSNYTVESPAPNAKVDADRAGTTKIEFSNIKDLTKRRNNATEYKETEFNKSNAGYNEIEIPMEPNAATVYIYSADKPEYCIMTTAGKAENNHVAYTFYDAKLQGVEVVETPKVEVIPIYTKTYKGDNSKKTSIKKDSSVDEDHVFYGVTVTSQSDQGTTFGHLKAADIVTAISTEMQKDEYKNGTYGADDPFRTILYVDMSSLNSISGDASSWNALIQGSADNCLFFMPSNFSTSQTMTGGGMIAGGENGVAVTDVVVVDQQPFYSPYNFRTSTHVANYARKVTPVEGYENTTTVTLVLPFSVALDDDGHPRTSSDHVNSNVLFSRLTDGLEKNDYNDKIYDVVLAPEGSGTAVAHTPYIVQQAYGVSDDGTIFDVSVLGATFVATGTQSGNAITFTPLTGTDASFKSYGTFSGDEIWDDAVFYFSKNYFWNTKTFPEGQRYINMRPFRAWYKSSNSTINSLAKFGLILGDETTGINEITTTKQNSNVVYDIQGRVVSNNGISTLPKGLYIMNGKKIFIK